MPKRRDRQRPVPTAPAVAPPSSRPARGAEAGGRYGALKRARVPAEGLGRMPKSANRDEVTATIPDPWDDRGAPLLATVDRRVDILEMEHSHGRISAAAYLTGRLLQQTFEHTSRIGGSNFEGGSRRDPREVRIYVTAKRVCDARTVLALNDRLRGRVGERSLRILRRVLGDAMSYGDVAAAEGKAGSRGTTFIAETFRLALEDAVEAVQQARGATRPVPDDAYRAAAETADGRQAQSVAAGATLARLEAELAHTRATGRFRDGERAGRGAIAVLEMEITRLGSNDKGSRTP